MKQTILNKSKWMFVFLFLLSVMSLMAISLAIPVSAKDEKYPFEDGYIYFNSSKGEVYGVDITKTQIDIPSEINGVAVTSIGYKAFYCEPIVSVTIPSTVRFIDDNAFGYCESLESVVISDGVTDLGYSMFSNCKSLKSVIIPDSITKISPFLFNDCVSLESITIPHSVTNIGNYAFSGCDSLISIVIPDNVTNIGDYAFSGCDSLVSIVIPNSVTTIEDYAFSDCDSIISIVIPDGVTTIGDYVFTDCDSLVSVDIGNNVTTIHSSAFTDCELLVSINVSKKNKSYIDIEGILFNKDKNVLLRYPEGKGKSYIIPNNVTIIGNYAFADCDSLISIVIPDSITSIDSYAFYDCDSLVSIIIPDGVTNIDNYSFSSCDSLASIVIPDSVTNIGNYAFSGCSSTSIVLSKNVSNIGDGAFYCCTSLKSILIPNSVITIGDFAFSACFSLVTVTIGNNVKYIGSNAFSFCYALKSIVIPDSVTTLGASSFDVCASLTSVRIGKGVKVIERNTFNECGSLTTVVLSSGIVRIDDYAFYQCSSLVNISVPDGVEAIGEYAFYKCPSLVAVNIPNSVTSLSVFAFFPPTIKYATVPYKYLSIFCESENIILQPGVTAITRSGYDYLRFKTITIPDSVIYLGDNAFGKGGMLTTVYYKGSREAWDKINLGVNAIPEHVTLLFNPFTDIKEGQWYTEGVIWCYNNAYMAGVSDTEFGRKSNVTRAMFATILAKIDGADTSSYTKMSFSDVKPNQWYSNAIEWAASNGYAAGLGEGIFGYKQNVSREQIALFFYTFSLKHGIDVSAKVNLSEYTDLNRVHPWALDAVQWAVANGLISGKSETTLAPRDPAARGEIALVIKNYVENVKG